MAPGALRFIYGAWCKFGVFTGSTKTQSHLSSDVSGGEKPGSGFVRSYYVQWPLSRTGQRAKPVIQNPVLLRVNREGCPSAPSQALSDSPEGKLSVSTVLSGLCSRSGDRGQRSGQSLRGQRQTGSGWLQAIIALFSRDTKTAKGFSPLGRMRGCF